MMYQFLSLLLLIAPTFAQFKLGSGVFLQTTEGAPRCETSFVVPAARAGADCNIVLSTQRYKIRPLPTYTIFASSVRGHFRNFLSDFENLKPPTGRCD